VRRGRTAFFACLAIAPRAAADEALVPAEQQREPLVLATGEAPAQTAPRPWTPPPHRWHEGVAVGVSFGPIWVEDARQGYFGRVDFGAYDIQTRRRGFIAGMLLGLEGWGAKASDEGLDKGGSVPLAIYGGLQQDAFFAVLGAGFDLALVDQVDHDTGVGFFAPLGDASLGLDLEGVRFLLNARPGYRWQLGAADRGVLRVGLTVQLTTD
jgi:hypothetical protein